MSTYEIVKKWLMQQLENYRCFSSNSEEKRRVDKLIEASRQAALGETEKKYHNLIVLKYITNKQITMQRICEILHFARDKKQFEQTINNAVDRLLVIAFGFYGIDWQYAKPPNGVDLSKVINDISIESLLEKSLTRLSCNIEIS